MKPKYNSTNHDLKNLTLQDKKKGKGKQLSKVALVEKIRPLIPELITEVVVLAKLPVGKNDNVKLGAIKLLMAKVLPDLKAQELSTDEGKNLVLKIVEDKTLLNVTKRVN